MDLFDEKLLFDSFCFFSFFGDRDLSFSFLGGLPTIKTFALPASVAPLTKLLTLLLGSFVVIWDYTSEVIEYWLSTLLSLDGYEAFRLIERGLAAS